MRRRPWFLATVVTVIAGYLTIPTLLVVPMSLSSGSTFQFPPPGWSLQWYERFFTSPQWLEAVANSFQVAAMAAPAATVIGTAAAFGLVRLSPKLRSAVLAVVMGPLIIPKILVALAVYGTFVGLRLSGTVFGIALAHTAIAIPYVVIAVTARLQGFEHNLVRAGLSLGASPFAVFRRVTLPLILPGILAGGLLAFATSFDELIIALFLQSPSATTLPVLMFNSVVYNIDLAVAAASTILVIVVSIVLMTAQAIGLRRSRKKELA